MLLRLLTRSTGLKTPHKKTLISIFTLQRKQYSRYKGNSIYFNIRWSIANIRIIYLTIKLQDGFGLDIIQDIMINHKRNLR